MRLINLCLTLVSLLLPLTSFSDDTILESHPQLHQITLDPRLSYEQYNMPNHIDSLGVIGLHALVDLNKTFYSGLGLYSAVKGESGGYFALALEGGLQHQLWKQWLVDGGARIGGGGGRNTPVGGGLFIEPYAGLKYDFGPFRAGAYYSYINFVDGAIASQQVGVELSMPAVFNYVTMPDTTPSMHFSDLKYSFVRYLGSTENYFAGLVRAYLPNPGITTTAHQPMESNFEFIGIEAAHYFSDYVFLFFNFAGAFHGHQNGYADELLGLGYRFPLLDMLDGIIKLGVGSGGGGAVNTGGGFIYEPMVGLEYRVNQKLGIELNAGYVQAPRANFQAKEVSVLVKYYLSDAVLAPTSKGLHEYIQAKRQSYLAPWRIRLLNQTYFKPYSSVGTTNPTMELLGADFDYFVSRYFYFTGQTAFAYVGRKTGGYFSGLLGFGAKTPLFLQKKINLFAEILAGTAGGAGLDIGQGALYEPVLGVDYRITDAWGLQASVGRLMAFQGKFRSTTLNGGISYRFWSIT